MVEVDDGAALALRRHGRSLLAAGVVGVQGHFERGDPVQVHDRKGAIVGFGLCNYAAADLARIRGLHSGAIQGLLGYYHGDEIIHRDNLVIVPLDEDAPQVTSR
ncbi:MAG: hypothetical protein JO122_13455 [Acetobacteraceae bacterium]|nr:hypothetical protein [Acetobacteraceae bacterium]